MFVNRPVPQLGVLWYERQERREKRVGGSHIPVPPFQVSAPRVWDIQRPQNEYEQDISIIEKR